MIDPNQGVVGQTSEIPPANNTIAYPDFDFGIAFSYKGNIYAGIAIHHLAEPSNSFYDVSSSQLQRKYTFHGGAFIDLTGAYFQDDNYGSFAISPNFLYMQQGDFHQLNIGMYVNYRPFIAGAWFRHNFENADAIVPMIGVEWKGFKVAYSYDVTLSQLKSTTGGAHEVSAGYQFNCFNQKRLRERAINCPRF
jgi:type IX secretion system PorP/SprF family membrane protein